MVQARDYDRKGCLASVELPPPLRSWQHLRMVRIDRANAKPTEVPE